MIKVLLATLFLVASSSSFAQFQPAETMREMQERLSPIVGRYEGTLIVEKSPTLKKRTYKVTMTAFPSMIPAPGSGHVQIPSLLVNVVVKDDPSNPGALVPAYSFRRAQFNSLTNELFLTGDSIATFGARYVGFYGIFDGNKIEGSVSTSLSVWPTRLSVVKIADEI